MPGTYQYDVEIKSNVAKLLSDMKQVQDRLDAVEGREYTIKLNIDEKKLSNVISNLEKMLDSLGKGTGDFKQFENLSKELSSIVSEVQSLSKAFGKVDDSGAKTLLYSIQNIDKSLSELSQNILNVNKNMSNMGSNTSGAVKQVENITNESKKAASALEDVTKAQTKVNGQKTNISSSLDSSISKYQEIVSLVKEYYELTSKLKQSTLKWQSKPEDYKRIDAYLATAHAVKGYTPTKEEVEKNINSTYHQMAKGINEGKDFAIKAMKSAIENYWSNITRMPSDDELLSARKIDRSYKGKSSEEYIIPKKYQDLEKSVIQETIAMNQNNAAYKKEQEQIEANNAAIKERLNLIRQSIKQNGISSNYNGEYKMGLSLKASDKDKKDIFKMTSDLSEEEMLQEICNMLGVKIPKNADKAKEAIKEVTSATDSTEQRKDAFPNVDTKLDNAVTSAKELDKTLEQVDIPTDSFDAVLKKLDLAKSELIDIIKITKQSVSDSEGKFHTSYTLKDSRGSSEIYGESSKTDKGQLLRSNIVRYDKKKDEVDISKELLEVDKQLAKAEDELAKAQQKKAQAFQKEQTNYENEQKKVEYVKQNRIAYEELTNTIKSYSEIAKRVASGNAEDGELELMTKLEDKISQLQKQPILSDSQVLKSEKSLVSLYDQLDKIERKLVETNQKSQDKQITGFDKRLESYTKKTSGYDATIARFNDGGWTSDTYLEKVQAIKNAVKEYETLLNNIKTNQNGIATDEDIQNLDKYEKKIKDTIATVTNMSASEKGYNFVSGQKELDKIHKLLNENSKMSSEAKAKIQAYYREIESGNPSMSLDKIHGEILKIYNAEVEAGRAGRTLWDTLKNSGFHQIAAQMAGMVGIYDVINMVRQGVNTVRELDEAMTEVRKVSNATEGQYDSFRDTISSTAKEIATTNKELLNSSADFLRLGYSLDQANDLAKNATLFVNVGDGVDITEATEDMITAMKAFDIKAEDSIKIVDDYNQIGNRFALSASDIGEAMKRSASALETGNNSFEQSIGLITAMNEIVQNSENTGNSLKVLSLRLRGAKAELEDMQEDTDGLCDSTSKLREQIKSLTGVDIMLDDNTFKSTTDIIKELGAVWDKLSDSSQAATLELIAGKSRANNVAALLKNYQKIDEVMESLGDAEGSAMRENEAIVDSINGRIKVLSATAEEFWQNFIDTDLVKELVSLTSDLLNILTKIVNIGNGAGTLGLIGAGTGIFKFIKNFDWVLKPYTKNSLQQFLVGQS